MAARLSIFFAILAATAQLAGQSAKRPPLPPVSYTCPMDPDIVEDAPGICPRCKMTLEPIRLDTAYSCPVHTTVIQTAPGKCPIDHRELVPITVSLYFTCADNATVHAIGPGKCADGADRIAARERRAHGDHNPRHGGQFFMASDNWHHLEGTYPRAGVFRLYFYDDFTKPLPKATIKDFSARVVTREIFDPAMKTYTDAETVPLTISSDGRALEAHVPTALPAQITAKVRFNASGAEHRFDFSFPVYTKEPKAGAPIVTLPLTAAKAQFEAPSEGAPRTKEALLAEIAAQSKDVQDAVANGAFGQIYLSALATKDAALELEALAGDLPDARRLEVSTAVRHIVLGAWLLDQYGDIGDRQKIEEAFQPFSAAVAALLHAYGAPR